MYLWIATLARTDSAARGMVASGPKSPFPHLCSWSLSLCETLAQDRKLCCNVPACENIFSLFLLHRDSMLYPRFTCPKTGPRLSWRITYFMVPASSLQRLLRSSWSSMLLVGNSENTIFTRKDPPNLSYSGPRLPRTHAARSSSVRCTKHLGSVVPLQWLSGIGVNRKTVGWSRVAVLNCYAYFPKFEGYLFCHS